MGDFRKFLNKPGFLGVASVFVNEGDNCIIVHDCDKGSSWSCNASDVPRFLEFEKDLRKAAQKIEKWFSNHAFNKNLLTMGFLSNAHSNSTYKISFSVNDAGCGSGYICMNGSYGDKGIRLDLDTETAGELQNSLHKISTLRKGLRKVVENAES